MLALLITDTKDFMSNLLIGNVFDNFSLVEADISTAITTTIDGRINKKFYSGDEIEALNIQNREYMPWSMVKPVCFQLIKGKNTPISFRITFSLSEEGIKNVASQIKTEILPEQIKGLLVNFRYDGKNINCTTATSLSVFTTNKVLDNEWDSLFRTFLKKHKITAESL